VLPTIFVKAILPNLNQSEQESAIAMMARVLLVNPDHGVVKNPILYADNVNFYGTATLWCPSLNAVMGRYGSQQ